MQQRMLSMTEWQESLKEWTVIEQSGGRIKVAADNEGYYYKCFYRPSFFSKRYFMNEAKRFAMNAHELNQRFIPAPQVDSLWSVGASVTIAKYKKLPGLSVRELWRKSSFNDEQSLELLAQFIAKLHDAGVYFRGLHVGNIVFHAGVFALLDVSDVQFLGQSLKRTERIRNFCPLLRYAEDLKILGPEKMQRLLESYEERTGFDICDNESG